MFKERLNILNFYRSQVSKEGIKNKEEMARLVFSLDRIQEVSPEKAMDGSVVQFAETEEEYKGSDSNRIPVWAFPDYTQLYLGIRDLLAGNGIDIKLCDLTPSHYNLNPKGKVDSAFWEINKEAVDGAYEISNISPEGLDTLWVCVWYSDKEELTDLSFVVLKPEQVESTNKSFEVVSGKLLGIWNSGMRRFIDTENISNN